jgi:iron complex outermembrane receptor protein
MKNHNAASRPSWWMALALVVLGWTGSLGAAQGTARVDLKGKAVHSVTGEPVPGASVLVEESDRRAKSGRDGSFAISGLAPGTCHLVIGAPGFVSMRLEVALTSPATEVRLELVPELHYSEVVSVSAGARDQFDAYQATSVLAGQELTIRLESTIGAALESQPGMAERSLGPGPSRPIIRGLDGDRVLILEDGQRTGDLSSQSGDHGVTVHPPAASRLEVVRGPATLLYGANAIGGLVNVITEIIPARPVTKGTGSAQFDLGSAADELGGAGHVKAGNGRYALHAGLSGRRSGDVGTPDATIDNTQSRSGYGHLGVSLTRENGYLGASYAYDDTRYGVPILEEGQVELTPRRHSVNLRGEWRELTGLVESVRGTVGYRRYRHDEVVAGEIGTRFSNDSLEFDVLANHRAVGRAKGSFGGWVMTRAFDSVGEEALSPPVDQRGAALFAYEEFSWPHVTFQLGARYDRASFDPQGGLRPRDFDNVSGSVGLLVRPTLDTALAFSLARSTRNPALEELYFFGPHPGNFAFEIGNAHLASETALGFDVSFRWRVARFNGEVSYFRNRVKDFIFRQPISEEAFDAEFGHDAHADKGHHGDEEFTFIKYVGADSVLQGVELHGDFELAPGLVAEIMADYVRGELGATGDPLPRMPPFRVMGGLRYQRNALQMGGEVMAVAAQDRVYAEETATDGYTLLKLFAAYSFQAGAALNTVTLRLDNATDTLYRNHLSYIKDLVPEMGRNLKVVYSVGF